MTLFTSRLLKWFDRHGRHNLPWQSPTDPYRVWVSEIMLQQTQVATVTPYFQRFIERFPDVHTLAAAPLDEVMRYWAGLGYYSRARNLHAAAGKVSEHGLPGTLEEMMSLPGIGRSTVGVILALAFGQRHPILDGNCKRVYARHRGIAGWTGDAKVTASLWQVAEELTPSERVADYTQAIMDLGATVCTRRKPRCEECPVQADCLAREMGAVHSFPGVRPKQVRPIRSTQVLVVESRQREVLLELRPSKGIWGGLWSLPEAAGEVDIRAVVRERFGVEARETHTLAPVRHQFTHFTLDMTPVHVRIRGKHKDSTQGNARWVSLDTLEKFGLPAPVTRILAMIESPA